MTDRDLSFYPVTTCSSAKASFALVSAVHALNGMFGVVYLFNDYRCSA